MKKSYQAAFQAATEKADAARALADRISIIDVDKTFPADGFTVMYTVVNGAFEADAEISHSDFGDWLTAAGHFDGFDGERLIQYSVEEPYYDYQRGEISYKPRGRDKSQPIAEYIRQDLDDSILAAYVAELLTLKNAGQ